MSNQITKVFVAGIYNWPASTTKEIRQKTDYPRHNWADIDILEQERFDSVLAIYKEFKINVISQRVGKGWHFLGDVVDYETWRSLWLKIKPYCDPLWPPHTIRISPKRKDEIWERPIYHYHKSEPPPWSRAVMSFMCKALRNENSTNLWSALNHVGIAKYLQPTVYPVEVKV